ncbi:MAG: hypothetical protein ACRD5H_00155 [Nitrososphaerales archaeon]
MLGGLFFSRLVSATEFVATMPGINLRFVADININNADTLSAQYVLAVVRDSLTVSAARADYIAQGVHLPLFSSHAYQFILSSGDRLLFGTSAGGARYNLHVYAREYLGSRTPYG